MVATKQTRLSILEAEHQAIDQHAIVSVFDLHGRILYVNDKCCTISGYSRDEIMGQHHEFLHSNAHSPEFYREMSRAIDEKGVWQGEICATRKDKSVYWLRTTVTPSLDENGKPYQLIAIQTDISIFKETVDKLAQTTHLFDKSSAAALIGHWEVNLEAKSVYWSAITKQIHDVDSNFKVRLEGGINFYKEGYDRETINRLFTHAVETGEPYDTELTIVTNKGQEKRVRTIGLPEFTNGHCSRIFGLLQDISERYKTEQQALTLSRIASQTSNCVLITDVEGKTEWINEGFSRVTGYTLEEMFGKSPGSILQGADSDPELISMMGQAIAERQPFSCEIINYKKSGEPFWNQINCNPLLDDQGDIKGFMTMQSDISDRKKSERALLDAKIAAERANSAKSDFLSSMSHELRTPLNAILGFAQLLEIDEELGDEQSKDVKEILTAGEHLLELINQVLDLSQVEAGHLPVAIKAVSVPTTIKDCLSLVADFARQKNVTIRQGKLDTIFVTADRTRLRQICLNFLTNAIKYNNNPGMITIGTEIMDNQQARIYVQDTGKGIANEQLDKIFLPFERLGLASTDIEGTGIGLTLSKQLAEAMGGEVGIESEVGVGSKFWIQLPLAETPDQV